MTEHEYLEDPKRSTLPETGIFLRAKVSSGVGWASVDLAHLTVESAAAWLESEGGLASRTLLLLLNHPLEAINGALVAIGVQKKESDLKALLWAAVTNIIEPMLISHLSENTMWRQVANEFVHKCAPILSELGAASKHQPTEVKSEGLSFPAGTIAGLFAARRSLVMTSMSRELAGHEKKAQKLIERAIDWCVTVEMSGPEEAERLEKEGKP